MPEHRHRPGKRNTHEHGDRQKERNRQTETQKKDREKVTEIAKRTRKVKRTRPSMTSWRTLKHPHAYTSPLTSRTARCESPPVTCDDVSGREREIEEARKQVERKRTNE